MLLHVPLVNDKSGAIMYMLHICWLACEIVYSVVCGASGLQYIFVFSCFLHTALQVYCGNACVCYDDASYFRVRACTFIWLPDAPFVSQRRDESPRAVVP